MNVQYHLTEEEARDGLEGLLPRLERNVLIMGLLFLVFSMGIFVNFMLNGHPLPYLILSAGFLALAMWFFLNRPLKIYFVSRRSASKDNLYLLTFSPEGWVRAGKDGHRVKLKGDKEARAVETPLTVSLRPDKDHMFVIPRTALKGGRLEELCELLKEAGCPVKRLEEKK